MIGSMTRADGHTVTERRGGRGLMASLMATGTALLLTVAITGTAFGSHNYAGATIQVKRGDKVVATHQAFQSCDLTGCIVNVPMNNRDFGRLARWCGQTTFNLVVENTPGSLTNLVVCGSTSGWHIRIAADTYWDAAGTSFATHASPVVIQVNGFQPSN